MSDQQLRKSLIRLAHAQPELRPTLLPLLTKQAEGVPFQHQGKIALLAAELKRGLYTLLKDEGEKVGKEALTKWARTAKVTLPSGPRFNDLCQDLVWMTKLHLEQQDLMGLLHRFDVKEKEETPEVE